MDKTKCPKCKQSHTKTFAKPTLCCTCLELQKQAQAKKKLEEEAQTAFKRSASSNPLTFKDLCTKKILSGDVLVCNADGWMFFPQGIKFDHLTDLIADIGILCDWGGVGSLFLEDPLNKGAYLSNPKNINKPINKSAWIYSYTPTAKVKELEKMWSSASAAGFNGMIITTQKGVDEKGEAVPNEIGKHQLLEILFKDWSKDKPDYFEDTSSILDHLAKYQTINLFWVRPYDGEFRDTFPTKIPEENCLEQNEFLVKILS